MSQCVMCSDGTRLQKGCIQWVGVFTANAVTAFILVLPQLPVFHSIICGKPPENVFFPSIITDFQPFSFTEQEMDEWERCLPNLHPQSPSLSGSRLIHAVAPKHNTLSHWASLTVETCMDRVALSSNLQETSRQTACLEKRKKKQKCGPLLWRQHRLWTKLFSELDGLISHLCTLYIQARGGVAPSFYKE